RAEQERLRLAEETAARTSAERALERLVRLQALTGALAAARTPEQVAEIVVERCVDVLAASCALFARSLASGELEVIAVRGLSAEWSTVHRHILGDGPLPAARAFTAGEAGWLGDAALVAEQYPETSLLGREVSALAA